MKRPQQRTNAPSWSLIACIPDLLSIVETVATRGQHEPGGRGPCLCSQCQLTRDARAVLKKAGYEFEN